MYRSADRHAYDAGSTFDADGGGQDGHAGASVSPMKIPAHSVIPHPNSISPRLNFTLAPSPRVRSAPR